MKFKERIFAPGPTPVPESGRLTLAEKNPYHRTSKFSTVIDRITTGLQDLLNLNWPIVPLAASGTGAMQMAVNNFVNPGDKAVVVESGKFGERWSKMLRDRGATPIPVEVEWGQAVSPARIEAALNQAPEAGAVFATLTETSTLVRHPIDKIGPRISDETLFVVDAISGFGADPFDPDTDAVDAFVLGSQKGLMAPPGLSLLGVRPDAVQESRSVNNRGTYFDLPSAVDKLRGASQTPWTPAMNLLRSLANSVEFLFGEGMESVIDRHETLASICRSTIETLGLDVFAEVPSNAGTSVLVPEDVNAETLRDYIDDQLGVYFPGGQKQLEGEIIRIGHLGHIDYLDLLSAVAALELGLVETGFLRDAGTATRTCQTLIRDRGLHND